MQFTLNMSNIRNIWDPVPDEVYKVRVTDVEDKESDKAGEYCTLELTVCEGEYAERARFSDNLMFTESWLPRTQKALRALTGLPWNKEEESGDTKDLLNCEGYVYTKTEAYPRNDGTTGEKSSVAYWVVQGDIDDSPV